MTVSGALTPTMIATWTSNMQTLILLVWEIGG